MIDRDELVDKICCAAVGVFLIAGAYVGIRNLPDAVQAEAPRFQPQTQMILNPNSGAAMFLYSPAEARLDADLQHIPRGTLLCISERCALIESWRPDSVR